MPLHHLTVKRAINTIQRKIGLYKMTNKFKNPTKLQLKTFIGTLEKLTDGRFNFSVTRNFKNINQFEVALYFHIKTGGVS